MGWELMRLFVDCVKTARFQSFQGDIVKPRLTCLHLDTVLLVLMLANSVVFFFISGKFTVTIPGVYQFSVQARAENGALWFNIKVKKSGVESIACWAWTNSGKNSQIYSIAFKQL